MKYAWSLVLILLLILSGCQKKEQNLAAGIPEINIVADTTTTGLVVQNIEIGSGKEAKKGNHVTVHYSGWLTSGKLFDSSIIRKKPFTLKLGTRQVIEGWEQGIQGMKVGGKRRLTIPSNLAYGDKGYAKAIPPKATLVFDIELLSVR